MSLLKIAALGTPVLRMRTQELTIEQLQSEPIQRLIDDMVATMRDAPGVGLAANQVYLPLRLAVVEVQAGDDQDSRERVPLTVLVNPRIARLSDATESVWEGCLSIPDLRGVVPRATEVDVEALDRAGNPVTIHASGFFARVLQHEIDHLDGYIYLDRMPDLTTLTYVKEFERYWLPASSAS